MEQVAEGLSDGIVSELARYSRSSPSVRGLRESPSTFQRMIDEELVEFEEYLAGHLRSDYSSVAGVMDSVAALQGKRLRPRLVFLSALACGGIGPETRRVAAVVELVHAATLVHDDVLDGSDYRRNTPAAHVAWGNHRSILLGDVLFSKAYLLAAGAGSCVVAQRVGRAGLALCEGELRQQASIGQWDLEVAEYVDILRQKTGDLCAASSYLGAWSAGASIERQRALEEYGLQLGIAFQIFDDWLDVWGTASVGKPLGNDIANRKPTMPSLRLLAAAECEPEQRALWVKALESGQLSDQLRLAMERSGASEATLELARRHAMAACDALAAVAESPAKQALIQVAQQSVRRVR